jgi:hypothetical protein
MHGSPCAHLLAQGLGLVFVAVYQKALSLTYVDELLAAVKAEFTTAHYKPRVRACVSMGHAASRGRQLHTYHVVSWGGELLAGTAGCALHAQVMTYPGFEEAFQRLYRDAEARAEQARANMKSRSLTAGAATATAVRVQLHGTASTACVCCVGACVGVYVRACVRAP